MKTWWPLLCPYDSNNPRLRAEIRAVSGHSNWNVTNKFANKNNTPCSSWLFPQYILSLLPLYFVTQYKTLFYCRSHIRHIMSPFSSHRLWRSGSIPTGPSVRRSSSFSAMLMRTCEPQTWSFKSISSRFSARPEMFMPKCTWISWYVIWSIARYIAQQY